MNSDKQIWSHIVSNVKRSALCDCDDSGLIKNHVISEPYPRESAFAAKILATEWRNSGDLEARDLSKQLIGSLQKYLEENELSEGLIEPSYTPRGVKYHKGSIPATILLIYGFIYAAKELGHGIEVDYGAASAFLKSCYLEEGRHFHDSVPSSLNKTKLPHIVNTSSMALWYYSVCPKQDEELKEKTVKSLIRSQRSDGFWPYREAGFLQKSFFDLRSYVPSKFTARYNGLLRDRSIYFGDAVHHCITLYYLLESLDEVTNLSVRNSVSNAWQFLVSKFIYDDSDHNLTIRFDFSWEPPLNSIRYCNFIDTSTYFYLVAIVKRLINLKLLGHSEGQTIVDGLMRYVWKQQQNNNGIIPAYEGTESQMHMIMPRPSESIFDKGFLLSFWI